ncbi:MAG: type IV secretory system conjugative DNA transfer family protein, partial [Cyanothece sp. SIO1E1]|nr:type IV secretory system conjugative DNA transfer family protein [Cyanothece sp. SIO1E1]
MSFHLYIAQATSLDQSQGQFSALQPLHHSLQSRQGLTLLGCLLLVGVFSMLGRRKKGKLATSHFGRNQEKSTARKRGWQQIKTPKKNAVCLYTTQPQRQSDAKPIYLPDAQRGIAVCGGPGSGKTFSIIDPLIRSSLNQGFPTIIYDFKYPNQSSRHAAYAARLGYKVRVFAPGFPESDVCNPLDFLRDETDAEMARQIATVMNKNFRLLGTQNTQDSFFAAAGDQLTEALLMLTKGTPYPDIITAQAILGLTDLGNRVATAAQAKKLNPWTQVSFNQLIGVKDAEKTVSGIVGTASDVFTRFMKAGVLGAFCGQTSLPLDLDGQELIIFGMDRQRRSVVGPLVATIMHMIVTRNVTRPRERP